VPYVDLNTIHNPATGTIAPAAWGDQARDNLEFLVDPPFCSVFNSAAVSLADNTATAMLANSENFDNDAMHSTVSNTSRITIQTTGRYQFIGSVNFAGDADGVRQVAFRIDGTTTIPPSSQVGGTATGSIGLTLVANIALTAGQYVECIARHTAGNALNCILQEFSAMFITR